jgi:hypothetical protein
MSHRGFRDRLGHGGIGQRVPFARLGDVPVLAELAGQVAARRAEAEHRCARQEMIERLLLDGIDAIPARPAIGGQNDPVVGARPHKAQPPLALIKLAKARTQIALDAPVLQRVPVTAGHAGKFFKHFV